STPACQPRNPVPMTPDARTTRERTANRTTCAPAESGATATAPRPPGRGASPCPTCHLRCGFRTPGARFPIGRSAPCRPPAVLRNQSLGGFGKGRCYHRPDQKHNPRAEETVCAAAAPGRPNNEGDDTLTAASDLTSQLGVGLLDGMRPRTVTLQSAIARTTSVVFRRVASALCPIPSCCR